MSLLDGQKLERNMIGKLVTMKSEEEVCGQTSPGKNPKIFVSHVNAHQRMTSAEEDFNQVHIMAHSLGY